MLLVKFKRDGPDTTAALLCHNYFHRADLRVRVLRVQEDHHVRVVFDRTGFSQVGQFWAARNVAYALELREGNDWNLEIDRNILQSARQVGNLVRPVFEAADRSHQLQVIDDGERDAAFGF